MRLGQARHPFRFHLLIPTLHAQGLIAATKVKLGGEGALGPPDGRHLVLHALSHHLQAAVAQLGYLVQEQDSVAGAGGAD